jgi:hypothetical protein
VCLRQQENRVLSNQTKQGGIYPANRLDFDEASINPIGIEMENFKEEREQ